MGFTKLATLGIEEQFVEAGHNFEVATARVQYDVDEANAFGNNMLTDSDHKVIFRKDTGQALGCMGAKYQASQPSQMWDMADEIVQKSGGMITESLTLDNGRVIGLKIQKETQEFVRGDRVNNGFLLRDSFDGTSQFCAMIYCYRMVCQNGMTVQEKRGIYNIRHTTNMNMRIGEATRMVVWYNQNIEVFNQKMRYLAENKISDREAIAWFKSLFPEPKKEGRSKTLIENKVSKFQELLDHGKGTEIAGVKGTQYWALNALTEFVNHHSTVRVSEGRTEADAKAESLYFGSGNSLMQKGLSSLLVA